MPLRAVPAADPFCSKPVKRQARDAIAAHAARLPEQAVVETLLEP
jgi:hypothetical protein